MKQQSRSHKACNLSVLPCYSKQFLRLSQIILSIAFMLLLLPFASALAVPTPTGYVNDFASVLSQEEKATLEATIADINKNTSAEIAILIIPSLEGEDRDLYATNVFRTWGVGDKEKNNGILILVVTNERKIRIEVGYGLEGSVTDVASGLVIRNILAPAFREEKYYAGLQKAVLELRGLIANDEATQAKYNPQVIPSHQLWEIGILTFLYLCLVIYASTVIKQKHKKVAYKGGSFLTIVSIAFIFGSIVGWLTLFLCFLILLVSSGGTGMFIPGWGGSGGLGGGSMGGGGFGGFSGGSSGGGGAGGGW